MIEQGAFKKNDRAFGIAFAMYTPQLELFTQVNIIMHRSASLESDKFFYDDINFYIKPFKMPLNQAEFGIWLLFLIKYFFAAQIFTLFMMQLVK